MPLILPSTPAIDFPRPAIITRLSEQELSRFRDPRGRFDKALMPMVPPAGDPAPPVITFIGRTAQTGSYGATSGPTTGISIGTAATDRYVLCIGHWYAQGSPFTSQSLTSLSFGATLATIHSQAFVQGNYGGSGWGGTYIVGALIPTGTTTSISTVVTGSHAVNAHWFNIYTITGLQSTTAFSTVLFTDPGTGSLPASTTIPVKKGGILIAGSMNYGANGTPYTFTPFTSFDYYNYQSSIATNATQFVCHISNLPTTTTQSLTMNKASGTNTTSRSCNIACFR